jgi:hypothetical protein
MGHFLRPESIQQVSRSGRSRESFHTTRAGSARLDGGEAQIPAGQTPRAEDVLCTNSDAVETLTETCVWVIEDAIYADAGRAAADTIDGAASLYRIDTDALAGADHVIGSRYGDRLAGGAVIRSSAGAGMIALLVRGKAGIPLATWRTASLSGQDMTASMGVAAMTNCAGTQAPPRSSMSRAGLALSS